MNNLLFREVKEFIKLDASKISSLERLGIYSIIDLLLYKPIDYKNKKINPNLSSVSHGDEVIFTAFVKEISYPQKKSSPTKIYVANENGGITLVFFKFHHYLKNIFKIGNKVTIQGKVEKFDFSNQISHPEVIFDNKLAKEIEPKYPLTYGITNTQIRSYIFKAISLINNIKEWWCEEFLKQLQLPSFSEAIKLIHAIIPADEKTLRKAYIRIKYDEAFSNQLCFKYLRLLNQNNDGRVFEPAKSEQNLILDKLGFALTSGQKEAMRDIELEQNSHAQMLRMLQGDVGCGKTLVVLLSAINVLKSGAQVAIMCPTEVLAQQHYHFFKNILDALSYDVTLLTSKITGKKRKESLDKISTGKTQLIVGTHSLLQEQVSFKDLGYIIVDEQHKFGVKQRMDLISKGSKPDVLIMSATPIPRSLSLTMFGDLAISKITSMPQNRKAILTFVSSLSKLPDVTEMIKKYINLGEKIYWVCPLIETPEGDEEKNFIDVATRYEYLRNIFGNKVDYLHGAMSQEAKLDSLTKLKNGEINILVSTTVIEVGIDISDATLIIIENAEKFGLAQLHQLRGRVGRGEKQSSCVLLYGKMTSKIAFERFKIMKNSTDGFFIAEKDLVLRGEGDIFGSRQSGEQNFLFLDLAEDSEIISKANVIAAKIKIDNPQILLINIFNKFMKLNEVVA